MIWIMKPHLSEEIESVSQAYSDIDYINVDADGTLQRGAIVFSVDCCIKTILGEIRIKLTRLDPITHNRWRSDRVLTDP